MELEVGRDEVLLLLLLLGLKVLDLRLGRRGRRKGLLRLLGRNLALLGRCSLQLLLLLHLPLVLLPPLPLPLDGGVQDDGEEQSDQEGADDKEGDSQQAKVAIGCTRGTTRKGIHTSEGA